MISSALDESERPCVMPRTLMSQPEGVLLGAIVRVRQHADGFPRLAVPVLRE